MISEELIKESEENVAQHEALFDCLSHNHNPTAVFVIVSAVGSQVCSAASAPSVRPCRPIIDPTFCLSN